MDGSSQSAEAAARPVLWGTENERQRDSHTCTLTHSYTHAQTLTHMQTFSQTHTLSQMHTHSHTLFHTHSHTLAHTPSLTHTDTQREKKRYAVYIQLTHSVFPPRFPIQCLSGIECMKALRELCLQSPYTQNVKSRRNFPLKIRTKEIKSRRI